MSLVIATVSGRSNNHVGIHGTNPGSVYPQPYRHSDYLSGTTVLPSVKGSKSTMSRGCSTDFWGLSPVSWSRGLAHVTYTDIATCLFMFSHCMSVIDNENNPVVSVDAFVVYSVVWCTGYKLHLNLHGRWADCDEKVWLTMLHFKFWNQRHAFWLEFDRFSHWILLTLSPQPEDEQSVVTVHSATS